ncbi:hypothetical protein [Saccharothrix xinjiangensis]|uniref:Tetratricopeptide repeat protein n=1 Tax=Saccharothrix xinjiangensis TaxID=204798 RepID=A0ABV9XZM1_9PSEU
MSAASCIASPPMAAVAPSASTTMPTYAGQSTLISRAELLVKVLSVPAQPAAAVSAELVVHVTGGSFADAQDVLTYLQSVGRATHTGDGSYRIRRVQRPGSTDDLRTPLLRHADWFLRRALAADLTIRPHDRRSAPPPTSTVHTFPGTEDAVRWYTDNARHLQALLPVLLDLGRFDLTWRSAENLWALSRWTGDHHSACEAQMIGLTVAQRSPGLSRRARLLARADHLTRAGTSLVDSGRHAAALPLCEEAVAIAAAEDSPTVLSAALAARAHAQHTAGHTGRAAVDLFRALERAQDDHSRALRHHHLAVVLTDLDRHDEAMINLAYAARLMRVLGDDLGRARVTTSHADTLTRTGHPNQAFALLADSLPIVTRSGCALDVAEAQAALGRCARATGDLEGALAWFTAARTNYLAAGHDHRAQAMQPAILHCAADSGGGG